MTVELVEVMVELNSWYSVFNVFSLWFLVYAHIISSSIVLDTIFAPLCSTKITRNDGRINRRDGSVKS